jgi:hypothetical protein
VQYQLVLILFNIVIGLAAYFFLRERRHLFRIIIMPVVYAYFLAAFLPYLLAYVPVNWVIAFYSVAVLLGLLAKGIDSRVQPDVEAEGWEAAAWSEADLDYIETRSEREALLNAFKFSKTPSENDEPPLPRILSESTTSVKKSSPSESFETSRPVLESALLGSISQPYITSASNPSIDLSAEKPGDDDKIHEKTDTRSDEETPQRSLEVKDTPEIVEEAPQRGIGGIHPLPQPEEKPAYRSTYVLRDDDADQQQVEEEKPAVAEPASTPHATVSYLSEYKEEKAALASAASPIVKPLEPARDEKPQPVKTTPVLNEVPLRPAAEIELNKKAVEEIAQKFAYKISNGHQDETSPAKEQETQLTAATLSESALTTTGGDRKIDQEDTSRAGEREIPVIAASLTDPGQEPLSFVKETQAIHQEPVVIDKPDESPPPFAAAMSETPAERHLELVEASRDQHPKENDPEISEGVEPLPTNQQIPVEDAGKMVLDKGSINDQQEAMEDDLMQLDLALVIDRAFQAKFSSDYQKAIRIFEVALDRTPSPKLAQMIADDIEVMRSKLA